MITFGTEETKTFLTKLGGINQFSKCYELLITDLTNIKSSISNKIISGKLKLEGNWSKYLCSDIDVIYEEDMIEFINKLNMYNISKYLPSIKGTDTGMICIYQFVLPDAYGGIMDILNIFHVIIKGESKYDVIDRMILMYQHE